MKSADGRTEVIVYVVSSKVVEGYVLCVYLVSMFVYDGAEILIGITGLNT